MRESFNKLSDAEDERLAILSEECSEVIKAVCKIQRHGYESYNPTLETDEERSPTNRETLQRELGDLQLAIELMTFAGDVDANDIVRWQERKGNSIKRWTHHQPSEGGK